MELEFEYFNEWARDSLKLDLSAYKEKQLQRRIGTVMNSAGAKNLREYAHLIQKDEKVRRLFLDYITINVTEFFRNKEIFQEFETVLTQDLAKRFGSLRIWSAACSIGAEPYSIAMILDRHRIQGASILATDIDETILGRAREGLYRENELKNLTPGDLERFFTQEDGHYRIAERLKKTVTFKRHDLLLDPYEKNLHAVICRNVTIYFKNEAKEDVYRRISDALVPGGVFFTGATESIYNPAGYGFKKLSTFLFEKV